MAATFYIALAPVRVFKTIFDYCFITLLMMLSKLATSLRSLLHETRDDEFIDEKVESLNGVRTAVKSNSLRENDVPALFSATRRSIASSQLSVMTGGFKIWPYLIERLHRQGFETLLAAQGRKSYQVLAGRLQEDREDSRTLSAKALASLWKAIPEEAFNVELRYFIRTYIKYMSLEHANSIPQLLLSHLPNTARNVFHEELDLEEKALLGEETSKPHLDKGKNRAESVEVPTSSAHDGGRTPLEPFTPPPAEIDDKITPITVDSAQTLAKYSRDIHNEFEVDENASTASWDRRVKPKLVLLRGIMRGNAPKEIKADYNALITAVLPGVLQTCRDNRTTVSLLGCRVIRELAFTTPQECGKHTERIFAEVEYLCHNTRQIVAAQGRSTINVLLGYVPFQAKYFALVSNTLVGVKNLNTRESAAIWMITLLSHGQDYTGAMASHTEIITTILRRGLNDREQPVKNRMSIAFWTFARLFESEAQHFFLEGDERLQAFLMRDKMSFNLSEAWATRQALAAPKTSGMTRKESKMPVSRAHTSNTSSRPTTAMSIPRPTSAMSASSPKTSRALPVRPAPPHRPQTAMGSTSIQSAGPRRALKSHASTSSAPITVGDRPTSDNTSISSEIVTPLHTETAVPVSPVQAQSHLASTKKSSNSAKDAFKKQTWRPARSRNAKPSENQLKMENIALKCAKKRLGRVRGHSDASASSSGSGKSHVS
ncbi:MAG: hypothetical protein Q9227_001554 [Pyrenula ochraceoflavens]